MSCDGGTHYAGCPCHEARWQERLAGAEATIKETVGWVSEITGKEICGGCFFGPAPHVHLTPAEVEGAGTLYERLAAAEARVRVLEEALTTIRLMCADGYYGPYAFTYAMEAKRIAALALAPPPEAEKNGGNDGR